MTQRKLARQLGLSAPMVTKLKRQGMPMDFAAAQAWRAENIRLRVGRPPKPGTLAEAQRLIDVAERGGDLDRLRAALDALVAADYDRLKISPPLWLLLTDDARMLASPADLARAAEALLRLSPEDFQRVLAGEVIARAELLTLRDVPLQ